MARHEHFDVKSEGVKLDLMITPMLDMAFQILSFFIIFYNPALETHFSGRILPPSEVARKGPSKPKDIDKPPPPVDEEPKTKDVIRIIVESIEGGKNEGEPKRILLKRPENPEPDEIAGTNTPFDVGLKKLARELEDIKKRAGETKLQLNLEADGHLRYQYFITIQNVCKDAKFDNLGFPRPTQ